MRCIMPTSSSTIQAAVSGPKNQYLGGIVSGRIDDRRHEASSIIEVMVDGTRAAIEIAVQGQESGALECWYRGCYRRDPDRGRWRVRWSQATSINCR